MTLEDKLNEKSRNLEILKNDLVKLGESREYVSMLIQGYTEIYFNKAEDVTDVTKCEDFNAAVTEHLLDIVKVKYPANYEILNKEFGMQ